MEELKHTKVCTKCGEEKDVSEFRKHISYYKIKQYLSYSSYCILCYGEYQKEYRKTHKRMDKVSKDKRKIYNAKYARSEKRKITEARYKQTQKFVEKELRFRHSAKYKQFRREYDQKQRTELSDTHIAAHCFKIPITTLKQYPELIEAKRAHLKLYREIRKVS